MSRAQSSQPVALEEALTAELFLEKGAVLVKPPLDPGDATRLRRPTTPGTPAG